MKTGAIVTGIDSGSNTESGDDEVELTLIIGNGGEGTRGTVIRLPGAIVNRRMLFLLYDTGNLAVGDRLVLEISKWDSK